MVSEADGEVSKSEINLINTQIERAANLTSPERNRLKVYIQWLITQTLSTKGIKKRIQSLAVGDRELIGDLLIQVSQIDGTISASEIKLMEKIYGMKRKFYLIKLKQKEILRSNGKFFRISIKRVLK
jgi:Tellurite resistance protein TerB.